MGKFKSLLTGLAKGLAGFVAFVVLAFVGLAGWMWHSSSRNAALAREFCDASAIGTPIAAVAARAQMQDAPYLPNDSGVHVVRFSGWGRSDCELTVVDGNVAGQRVVTEAYD